MPLHTRSPYPTEEDPTIWDDAEAFAVLDDFDTAAVTAKSSKEEKFPCGQCAGTGVYQGVRRHQVKSNCFACRGKGFFKTDPRKLKVRRDKAAALKADKTATSKATNSANETIFGWVTAAQGFNEFAASLMTQHLEGRMWTVNQLRAVERAIERAAERKAEQAAAKPVEAEVDLGPIRNMFEEAFGRGLKRPTYRAEGLIISRAPDHGTNPGALYVKSLDDVYGGKVIETVFFPTSSGEYYDFTEHGPAKKALQLIAADPLQSAIRYGRRTGTCSCCGRKLTKKDSIDAGIGPICAGKWGFGFDY